MLSGILVLIADLLLQEDFDALPVSSIYIFIYIYFLDLNKTHHCRIGYPMTSSSTIISSPRVHDVQLDRADNE